MQKVAILCAFFPGLCNDRQTHGGKFSEVGLQFATLYKATLSAPHLRPQAGLQLFRSLLWETARTEHSAPWRPTGDGPVPFTCAPLQACMVLSFDGSSLPRNLNRGWAAGHRWSRGWEKVRALERQLPPRLKLPPLAWRGSHPQMQAREQC